MRNPKAGLLGLLSSTALLAGMAPITAAAQTVDPVTSGSVEAAAAADAGQDQTSEIVVTGSRIRRSEVETSAPVTVLDEQQLLDRGFVTAAQGLNQVTSNVPSLGQASGSGDASGSGQQSPNLFGLGAGRTLTLVNGRRFVTTSSGVGDSQVDANVIPIGLLQRIDVVQAGGAAVYGSDAVAGVVNYTLKDHFQGLELDAQNGISSRGDYPVHSLRGTAGLNFGGGRGNIAADVEWSKTPVLAFRDRPRSALGRLVVTNPADTGPGDGIPSSVEYFDAHFYPFNADGVIFNSPAPVTQLLTRLNGTPLQFSPSGAVVPFNTGTVKNIPFASGGDGFPYRDLVGLRTGVERLSANVIGHYDLTDHIKVSTELLYARTRGTEISQPLTFTTLNSAATGAGPIAFTNTNPFLTPATIATLSAARPSFATGAPLFLSKAFYDIVPRNDQITTTNTYRGVIALDGDFNLGTRNFYWSASASFARVEGQTANYEVINSRLAKALNAVRNGAGQIVCAVNADAGTANDDPACAPLNPFGSGNVSQAARDYVSTIAGTGYVNKQADLLATLGGSIVTLPAGDLKFSLAYEHRIEAADFTPFAANRQGLFGAGTLEVSQSGKYNTDEFSGELLVPLVGGNFTLPGIKELEASGAYRRVDNSLAGKQDVWNGGLRWTVLTGLTLRGSRSRNFRAPTLAQLLAPTSTALGTVIDPCDADRINAGPNPAARRANCQALFAANPAFGPLATFQDPAENFARTTITSGGNPNLRNEISNTLTYGIVLQPRFVPGLTLVADRIEIDLRDGLSAFGAESFAATCFDTTPQPADICSTFTRLAASDGVSPAGTIVTGLATTFNAGVTKYRGEVYNLNYAFAVGSLLGGGDLGTLELGVEATHSTLLTQSVTGTTFTRTDNTIAQPSWTGRLDLRYAKGPFRFTYQLYYLDRTRSGPDATIENTPTPIVARNLTHSVSAQYDLGKLVLRAGVTNLTDAEPSYPTISYGDILGRRFFLGATLKLF